MLNKLFKARLSKIGSRKKDDEVILEFVLTYTSEENVQDFLEPIDNMLGSCLRHVFTSDRIEWKRITLDVQISLFKIKFDELEMDADLCEIRVSRKVVTDGEIFKYDLIFNKGHNPDIDSVFAITYLNRKEENDEGKLDFLLYDTLIKK